MGEQNDELRRTLANAKEWGKLYVENLKLLSIEKTTVLLSHGAMAVLLLLLGVCAFFFISIALVLLLAQVLPVMWCFLIMGAFTCCWRVLHCFCVNHCLSTRLHGSCQDFSLIRFPIRIGLQIKMLNSYGK